MSQVSSVTVTMTTCPTPSLTASLVIPETPQGGLPLKQTICKVGKLTAVMNLGLKLPRWQHFLLLNQCPLEGAYVSDSWFL